MIAMAVLPPVACMALEHHKDNVEGRFSVGYSSHLEISQDHKDSICRISWNNANHCKCMCWDMLPPGSVDVGDCALFEFLHVSSSLETGNIFMPAIV